MRLNKRVEIRRNMALGTIPMAWTLCYTTAVATKVAVNNRGIEVV
jgi:hypothetical protein